MRELQIGEQVVRVRATPLALLFYRQEFGTDLLGDLVSMVQGVVGFSVLSDPNIDASKIDFSKFDSIAILRIIWAMAKADTYGREKFPSFVEWLASFDSFDFADSEMLNVVIEEASNGFFRTRAFKGGTATRRPK